MSETGALDIGKVALNIFECDVVGYSCEKCPVGASCHAKIRKFVEKLKAGVFDGV